MQQPFANCKYQICDLPGQCVSEGACHHPKEPAPIQGVKVAGDMPIEVIECRVEPSPNPAAPVSATPEFTGRTLKRHSLNSINAGLAQCDATDLDACFYKKTEVDRHINRLAAILEERERELAEAKHRAAKLLVEFAAYRNAAEARAAELQKAMEALRDDMLNKVMAATDDQIEAAIRMEGRDPKDVAALTRQALTNALHTVEMNKLQDKLAAETARADGAHNAAIDAVTLIPNLALSERQRFSILALKVPQ